MQNTSIIGFERDPASPLRPKAITNCHPIVHDANRQKVDRQGLLERVDFGATQHAHGLSTLAKAAPEIAHAVSEYRNARTAQAKADATDRFADAADVFMEHYAGGHKAGKADADLYALLSPVYQMAEIIERVYAMPTLINELPKRALGTPDEVAVYLTYEDHLPAVEHDWSLEIKDAGHATGTVGTATIRLKPIKASAQVSGRDREIHEARRGRMGAMDFDLFGRQVEVGSMGVLKRAGQMVAWGDASLGVQGLISSTNGVTAVNANYDSGTGLTDYGTIAGQINLQAQQVNWMEDFLADTIYIDPQSFYNLSSRLISNTGDSGDSVLSRIFLNFPRIQRVLQARELAPLASEIAEETPKVGATEAALLGGGYLAGTYRRCMVITKNAPDVHEWMEGIPLQVVGLEPRDTADRAVIRMSCGGTTIYRTSVPRIVYI